MCKRRYLLPFTKNVFRHAFSGEDSQRTLSEYTIATDRPSSRGHRTPRSKRSRSLERPSSSSRARSAASHHDSDVYVTSAAYRPPSEMRCEFANKSSYYVVISAEILTWNTLPIIIFINDDWWFANWNIGDVLISVHDFLGEKSHYLNANYNETTRPKRTIYLILLLLSRSRGSHYTNRSGRSRGAPSHYSYRSNGLAPSEVSTVKSKITRKPGMTIETMSAPNPFCPNTKGMCCLMLLLNLGLILVTLGFVIVIQFFEPLFVW